MSGVERVFLSAPISVEMRQERAVWWRPLVFLLTVQGFLWGLVPLAFISSLHQDTLEIIYWGRDLAFGYYKHPPLPTWLLDVLVRPDHAPIAAVLLVGAVSVAVTGAYIFRTVSLFAPPASAMLALVGFLATRCATYQSPQVNHNSLLLPLWAALIFHALRFFERRRPVDAILAGLVAGLAVLVKYEVLFLFESLVLTAVLVPAYRTCLRDRWLWLAAVLFTVLIAPHVAWMAEHRDQSIRYALDSRNIEGILDALDTLNHFVVGHAIVLIGPLLALGVAFLAGWRIRPAPRDLRFAMLIGLGPSAFLVIMDVLTLQIIRDGWIDPLAPSLAIGLGLAVRLEPSGEEAAARLRLTGLAAILACLQLAGFFLFLLARAQFGAPVAAYDLDARTFAADVQTYWHARHAEPLHCMVVDNHLVPAAPTVWIGKRPHVVELGTPGWSRPEQMETCRQRGGVVVLQDATTIDRVPEACRASGQRLRVASPLSGRRAGWDVTLFDLPPGGCPPRDQSSIAPPSTR
jgi:4-amino-4-deoxy-L-arabinose transferase-like glycosyltransferase